MVNLGGMKSEYIALAYAKIIDRDNHKNLA
jgi:hypothetical protein